MWYRFCCTQPRLVVEILPYSPIMSLDPNGAFWMAPNTPRRYVRRVLRSRPTRIFSRQGHAPRILSSDILWGVHIYTLNSRWERKRCLKLRGQFRTLKRVLCRKKVVYWQHKLYFGSSFSADTPDSSYTSSQHHGVM